MFRQSIMNLYLTIYGFLYYRFHLAAEGFRYPRIGFVERDVIKLKGEERLIGNILFNRLSFYYPFQHFLHGLGQDVVVKTSITTKGVQVSLFRAVPDRGEADLEETGHGSRGYDGVHQFLYSRKDKRLYRDRVVKGCGFFLEDPFACILIPHSHSIEREVSDLLQRSREESDSFTVVGTHHSLF